jgi:hypothetical protein
MCRITTCFGKEKEKEKKKREGGGGTSGIFHCLRLSAEPEAKMNLVG